MSNVSNYAAQGGNAWHVDGTLTVGANGEVSLAAGAAITAAGTQAAAITDLSVTGTYATDDTPIETAVNSILAALRDVGIIASS